MRAWYHMDANQLANPSGGSGACIGGSFHCSDVASDEYSYVACADVFLTQELYVRGFYHRVSCFHRADEPFGFNHAECFHRHLCVLTFFSVYKLKSEIVFWRQPITARVKNQENAYLFQAKV